MAIEALMIDVDGVLVTGRPPDGRHWATDLQVDLGLLPDVLHEVFFKRHWEDIVTGQADVHERLSPVLAEIAPGVTSTQLLAYWFARDARLDEQLLEDLVTARAGGLQVYLTTNQEHERASYLMDTLGLATFVDGCHYSAAIGHRKPFPAFYDAVAGKVGFRPDELLLIDDSAANVQAAIASGWQGRLWTQGDSLQHILAGLAMSLSSRTRNLDTNQNHARQYACAILCDGNRILLGKRAPHKAASANKWDLIGGLVEDDETPEEALVREVNEELGVAVVGFQQLGVIFDTSSAEASASTLHLFLVRTWSGGQPRVVNHEHTELAWLTIDEACSLPGLALEGYRGVFRDLRLGE